MKTWTLEYTVIDTELEAEKTVTLEGVSNPEGVPAILEGFIKDGILICFRLELNVPSFVEEDHDYTFGDEDDYLDEDWEDEDYE